MTKNIGAGLKPTDLNFLGLIETEKFFGKTERKLEEKQLGINKTRN